MSGRQVSRSNTYSRLSHPSNASFPSRTPGWTPYSNMNNVKGSSTRFPSGSEFSTSSGPSEQSFSPASPSLPVGRICIGQPYDSRCVETSHLVKGPKVAKKPACQRSNPQCLLCTDRPSCPSSPTFLDQLIKGINYLDRSTNIFSSRYPKSLSLPQLAATCLERAANSLYLDPVEHAPPPRSYSTPSTNITTASNHYPTNNCLVPSGRDTSTLQCVGGSAGPSCQHQAHNQSFSAEMLRRPDVRLPEIPLFGNGFFSLGRLPKFWEAIRSGWNGPEPTSKPSGWW